MSVQFSYIALYAP